jgi:transposase
MIYVGVDIAKASHCVAAIEMTGRIVQKPKTITQDAAGFAELGALLRRLGSPETVRIGFEATGHYWLLLAEEVQRLGYTPQVFNPILSADAGRVSVRGRKTDEDDALVIAKVLRDGEFVPLPLPSREMAYAKQCCRHRQAAVDRGANLKKRLTGLLDLVFPEFCQFFEQVGCPSSLVILKKAPSARLMATGQVRSFASAVAKASRGSLGAARVQEILLAAKTSLARDRVDVANEMAIRNTVAEIELLDEQISAWDAEIRAIEMPGRELLQTIPGIGVVLAAVILAEIGTIERFTCPDPRKHLRRRPGGGVNGYHRLLAFAGLDARVRESGQWTGATRMSKRGSRILRTAIWRAAFIAKKNEAFADIWHRHAVTQDQHPKLARSHIARKLVQAIYGVLRYQKPFDLTAFRNGVPQKAAAA